MRTIERRTNPVLLRVDQKRYEYFLNLFKENPNYKYIVISKYDLQTDYSYCNDMQRANQEYDFRSKQYSCRGVKIEKVSTFIEEIKNRLEHLWS